MLQQAVRPGNEGANICLGIEEQNICTCCEACGLMTGPAIMWHIARSESDSALAREVRISASKKSDHVTSRTGVATLNRVLAKKRLFPYTAK